MRQILSWWIGSDRKCEHVIVGTGVAGRHCRLIQDQCGFRLHVAQLRFPTCINQQPAKGVVALTTSDVITIGNGVRVPWPSQASAARRDLIEIGGPHFTVGRDAACNEVLDIAGVSRRHALFRRSGVGYVVEDLRSANGTFVNGTKIQTTTIVKIGDVIGLGNVQFEVTPFGLEQCVEAAAFPNVEVRQVTVEVPARRLLEDVSFTIVAGEFVGLMGPSGAGKTTLLSAMNGYSPPTEGSVVINGHDLYENYDRFRSLLGYVPQDDIMHGALTVSQALRYTAELRMVDASPEERAAKIAEVLEQLGLEATANTLIGSPERKGISGGQRKRVNLAMELLTDPGVLFLDEPTSGLSSEDAFRVMSLLRKLADAGKIVLLTVHQPSLEAYRLLDDLVLISKDPGSAEPGRLVYFGPAYPDALRFFNPSAASASAGLTPEDIFRGMGQRPSAEWHESYEGSALKRDYVIRRAGKCPTMPETEMNLPADVSPFVQCATLAKRLLAIKISDRWNSAILLAQAPIVACIIVLVFGEQARQHLTMETWAQVNRATSMTLFLAVLSAFWFGSSNAVREIVGEWAIYRRERMVNLSIPAYVLSKLLVGTGLCVVQCVVLLGATRWGCALQAPPFASFLLLMLIAETGLAVGLLLSAIARSNEVAIGLLPLILIPIVVFGGALLPVGKMQAPVKLLAYSLPLRAGFEGMLVQESQRRPLGPSAFSHNLAWGDQPDDPDRPDMAEYYFPKTLRLGVAANATLLVIMFSMLVLAIGIALRFRDIH